MELIIGLIVIAVVAYFVFKPKKTANAEAAPYKVEAAPEASPVAEQASQAVVESIVTAKKPRAKKPAAKKVAAKKTTAKKPAAKKTAKVKAK
jgi:uncharacterized membrane protein YfcA